MSKDKLFIILQYILPHHLLSRLVRGIANCKLTVIKNLLIRQAIRHFNININEAEHTDLNHYISFNDFFIRKLKCNVRVLDTNINHIVHPADGKVTQHGKIADGLLLQAKNRYFSLDSLIANSSDQHYTDYVITYLSPRDYHRVHMPLDGTLTKMVYVPGKLYSVNTLTANNISNLFAKNERLICYFDTQIGEVSIIMVGAMLVAGIVTSWHGIVTPSYYKDIQSWHYKDNDIHFSKGDEIGYFEFGSTTICLFPDNKVHLDIQDDKVNVNSYLGKLNSK